MTTPTAWASLLMLAGLAACGGALNEAPDEPMLLGATHVVSPLLDDEGGVAPSAPALVPQDPAARTRRAAYASPAQAEQLQLALGAGVVSVQVDGAGLGWRGVEAAVQAARQQVLEEQLSFDAPVLVRGSHLPVAAAVADELVTAGFGRVFLVTAQ